MCLRQLQTIRFNHSARRWISAVVRVLSIRRAATVPKPNVYGAKTKSAVLTKTLILRVFLTANAESGRRYTKNVVQVNSAKTNGAARTTLAPTVEQTRPAAGATMVRAREEVNVCLVVLDNRAQKVRRSV